MWALGLLDCLVNPAGGMRKEEDVHLELVQLLSHQMRNMALQLRAQADVIASGMGREPNKLKSCFPDINKGHCSTSRLGARSHPEPRNQC